MLVLRFLSVSLLCVCVCLHCTVSSAYTSVHNLATHMCHLPYNCHLHSQWARLRHTKVACHIHVSFAIALTETRRSGSLFLFYFTEDFDLSKITLSCHFALDYFATRKWLSLLGPLPKNTFSFHYLMALLPQLQVHKSGP